MSKIQEINFACQDTFQPSHSFKPVHKSSFVHLIFCLPKGMIGFLVA